MSVNWPTVKLGEIVEITSSKRVKRADYVDQGVPFFRSKEVIERSKGNRISTELFITEKHFEHIENKIGAPKEGDILLTSVGTLGIPYQIEKHDRFYFKDGNLTWFRNFSSCVNSNFLYYWLTSPVAKQKFDEVTIGSTQKALTIVALKSIDLQLPPIPKQEYIASILGSLDGKLSINRHINQTLEQIAQALFKSWFVDFDPVNAKIAVLESGGCVDEAELAAMGVIAAKSPDELAELKQSKPEAYEKLAQTAALFPSTKQESELGEIPKGWEVKSFGDVSKCYDSKRIPLSKKKREEKKPGLIPYYGATSIMDYVNEWIFDDTYLLLGEDGSVVKDDGTPFVQYIWGKAWVNNHAHVLQGVNGVSTEQLMIFIQSQNIAAFVTGAVQLKLNQGNMNSIPFLKANEVLNAKFQELITPSYEDIRSSHDQSLSLIELRDALLPRLLSGELPAEGNL